MFIHLKIHEFQALYALMYLSQIKGKESENSYEELKRSLKDRHTQKLYRDISTGTAVFINRKRVKVCEHTTKMASCPSVISSISGKSFHFPFPYYMTYIYIYIYADDKVALHL